MSKLWIFVCLLALSQVAHAACTPEGKYKRAPDGGRLTISKGGTTDSEMGLQIYKFELSSQGQQFSDGASAAGDAWGNFHLSEEKCIGLHVDDDNTCELVFVFTPKYVDVFQFRMCGLGVGATANGRFQRTSK
jgi:hypothetical protein